MGLFRRPLYCPPFPLTRAAATLAVILAAGAYAQAQGTVKSVHDDWQIRCDNPPGASEQCALIQSVTAEDRPNVGLSVIVLKTADQKTRLLRVLAPLGVLLPSGLGLKIDQTDIGRAGYLRRLLEANFFHRDTGNAVIALESDLDEALLVERVRLDVIDGTGFADAVTRFVAYQRRWSERSNEAIAAPD